MVKIVAEISLKINDVEDKFKEDITIEDGCDCVSVSILAWIDHIKEEFKRYINTEFREEFGDI